MGVFYLRPSDRYPPRETVTCDESTRVRTGLHVGAAAIDVEMSRGRRAAGHPAHRAPGMAEWEPRIVRSEGGTYVSHARAGSETVTERRPSERAVGKKDHRADSNLVEMFDALFRHVGLGYLVDLVHPHL